MKQQGRETEFLVICGKAGRGGTGKEEVKLRVTASAFEYISDREVAIPYLITSSVNPVSTCWLLACL